jgi:hypothetical protein
MSRCIRAMNNAYAIYSYHHGTCGSCEVSEYHHGTCGACEVSEYHHGTCGACEVSELLFKVKFCFATLELSFWSCFHLL